MILLFLISVALAQQTTPIKPEAVLIDPVPRKDTSGKTMEDPPCGGRGKGLAHTLAEPGQFHPVTWMIVHPAETGNCTFRLTSGTDFNKYVTLAPTDNSADASGWFPCGRKELYHESKTIVFPDHFTCDECTLQWIWKTYIGTFYQCSEIQVRSTNSLACFGKCKNGGVCTDGNCECPVGFSGQFCQDAAKETEEEENINVVGYLITFLIFVIVCSALATIVYYFFNQDKIPPQAQKFLRANCQWCLRKEAIIEEEQREERESEPPVVQRERLVINV